MAPDLTDIDANVSFTNLDAHTDPDDCEVSEYHTESDDINGSYDSELEVSET